MGRLFNNRTEVVYQNPQHPKEYFTDRVRKYWVLVPMCAYKVLVPYPREKMLNLFQETILKLFLSGAKEAGWIADNLALNISLVEFIIEELKREELLSKSGSITQRGKDLIAEQDDSYEMKTGYVFYNYLTKNYADTFIQDNEIQIVNSKVRGRNIREFYISEDVSNPITQIATIIHGKDEQEEISPTANDILRICRKHKKRSQQMVKHSIVENREHVTQLPKNLEKVKFLGDKKFVYVATYMFLPYDELTNRSNMQVCYPFLGGISPSLMDAIEDVIGLEENSVLKEEIKKLKEDVYGLSEEELKKVREDNFNVDNQIKQVLSKKIEKYPGVYRKLLEVEKKYMFIQRLMNTNAGKNYHTIQKNIKEYVVENYNLISEILLEVAQSQDYYADKFLTNYPSQNVNILSTRAIQCGFSDIESDFSGLFSLKKGSINRAKEDKKAKHLLAYNLIIAGEYNEHPFYKLAKAVPNFCTYIARLIDMRNDCNHPNDTPYNLNDIAALSIKNMYIAAVVLEGLQFKQDREFDFESNKVVEKHQIKIVKQAEAYIEEVYDVSLNKYGFIKKLLIALQQEVIIHGTDFPSKVSAVYEAILRLLCKERLNEHVTMHIKSYNEQKQYLKENLKEKGFEIDQLPHYTLNNVKGVFRNYNKGTLITLMYAWIYSELRNNDGFLEEISSQVPELIKIIECIRQLRGHSNKVDFKNKDVLYINEHMSPTVLTLLKLMEKRGIY